MIDSNELLQLINKPLFRKEKNMKNILAKVLVTTIIISLFPLVVNAITDEELQDMSFYELEALPKREIDKSQRKLLKSLLKDNEKKIESCRVIRDEYYSLPYVEFLEEEKNIQSKSQKKLYAKILKNRKKYEQLWERNKPRFSVTSDEFSGSIKFKTNMVSPVGLGLGKCPDLKGSYARVARWEKTKSFFRGTIAEDDSKFLQLYVQHRSSNANAMSQYYGIREAISKNIGKKKSKN